MPINKADDEERYLNVKEAAKLLGVHPITLYRWVKKGKIRFIRTASGRIRFPYSEITKLRSPEKNNNVAIYARVPDKNFEDSGLLQKQIEALKFYAQKNSYNIVAIISDIGLINKKSILRLINMALTKKIGYILMVDDSRLSPIFADVFKAIFSSFGVEIKTIEFDDDELEAAKKVELIDILKIYMKTL